MRRRRNEDTEEKARIESRILVPDDESLIGDEVMRRMEELGESITGSGVVKTQVRVMMGLTVLVPILRCLSAFIIAHKHMSPNTFADSVSISPTHIMLLVVCRCQPSSGC